jgi:hypothetical protein
MFRVAYLFDVSASWSGALGTSGPDFELVKFGTFFIKIIRQ